MALTYTESAELMKNGDFIGRVKVGCITYARYISDEANSVPAHSTRLRWANNTMLNPDSSAQQVTPTVVMDSAVQNAGVDENGVSLITDAALQGAVENAVNKLM